MKSIAFTVFVAIFALLTGATSAGAEITQPASNPQPVGGDICRLGQVFYHAGDETLPLQHFTIDLPQGDFLVATMSRSGALESVDVCYLPDASSLKLHPVSGAELRRDARSGPAHGAFDAIVASVRPPFDASLGVRMPATQPVD